MKHCRPSRQLPVEYMPHMSAILPEPKGAVFLTTDGLDWALNHAREYGDTVFLPLAFEYEAIAFDWLAVRDWLCQQNMVQWQPRPLRRFLATKTRYSFRFVTQLDPLEYLAFTALLATVGPQMEAYRIPADQHVAYSWRFSPDATGQMYDPSSEWTEFTERCLSLAREQEVGWVVVADIADFFPHIYIHPVERVLAEATNASPEAYCLMRMIRNWNAFVSYGLPVGIAGSRIIAEATIHDVDQMMLGSGRAYCRYADDIRIFCESERDAYAALEELASHLFESHGLTMQPSKTDIMTAVDYLERFSIAPERVEAESLTTRFRELLETAGISDKYDAQIDYDDLPVETQEQIDKLNLVALFGEQIAEPRSDPVVMKILLHRLGQLNIDDIVDDVLDNLESLGHIIDSVIRYLGQLRGMDENARHNIGSQVLDACSLPSTGAYQRVCLLSLFTAGREFDNEDRFQAAFREFTDTLTRREIVLAMGRAGKAHWFQAERRNYHLMEPWLRRAFLAAFSCVSPDARGPFYRSLRGGVDVLEGAVIKWASANPFA